VVRVEGGEVGFPYAAAVGVLADCTSAKRDRGGVTNVMVGM
jgi:hypothetical protein